MIWESVIAMTNVDVVILTIAAVTACLFLRLRKSIFSLSAIAAGLIGVLRGTIIGQ